ncbi:MAG TPA: homocysteine S-methyltransferase [Anaerolineales bacterium]|nr:homocysteine S-methyltransferase [Anaerolineae bacterium]HRJ58029.1 homocysteine S-methyltransferase [Anaerolineales bacterium]HRK90481.1 homocysteine S-methyltransferase [Anaerolineales bacterium]
MNVIEEFLKRQRIAIIDGAMATELEARGCDLNDDLWSARVLLEQPELIRAVHLDYFNNGADIAITASYQATVEGFARRGLSREQALDLIKKSVQLAQEARDEFWAKEENRVGRLRPLIAGSVGPYGAYLADGSEYRGDYNLSEDELIAFHRPRVEAHIASGADLLACETIPCGIEARALIRLLAGFPNTLAWFTFTAKDGEHISNGERIADIAAFLDSQPQAAAIGINCTSPLHIPSLVREIKKNTNKPIIVYPNSGEYYSAVTNTWHGETSSDKFGLQSKEWYENGATLIGGCCRTTPGHIREISNWSRK